MAAVRVLLDLNFDLIASKSDEEIMDFLRHPDTLKKTESDLSLFSHQALRVVPFCIDYLECRERAEDVSVLFVSDEERKEKWFQWHEQCRKLCFSRDRGGLLSVLIGVGEVMTDITTTSAGYDVMKAFLDAIQNHEWNVRADGRAFILAMGRHGSLIPTLMTSTSSDSIEDRAPEIYDSIRHFDALQTIYLDCLHSVCADLAEHVPAEFCAAYAVYEKLWVGAIKAFGTWLEDYKVSSEDSATLCHECSRKSGNLPILLALTSGDKEWINSGAEDFVARASASLRREWANAASDELPEYQRSSDKISFVRSHSMVHTEKCLRLLARQGVVRALTDGSTFSSALIRDEFKKMVGLL